MDVQMTNRMAKKSELNTFYNRLSIIKYLKVSLNQKAKDPYN